MNTRLGAIGLALCAVGALAMPTAAHAGNVGYTAPCLGGDVTSAIVTAGHTPVAVASLDAASLAPLDALIIESCLGYSADPDVDAAVADGMVVIINDWLPSGLTAGRLPGSPAITFTYNIGYNINLAAGSPIATGPGGTLTDASLDSSFFLAPAHDGYTASTLPPDAIQLLTRSNVAGRSVGLAYPHGNGLVVYNAIPVDTYLPSGPYDDAHLCTPTNLCGGIQTYMTNLIAWSIKQVRNCASEGYTGTQLQWCQNICEKGYTGTTLNTWIRRWMGRWHDLPYCAREDEEEPPQEQPPA